MNKQTLNGIIIFLSIVIVGGLIWFFASNSNSSSSSKSGQGLSTEDNELMHKYETQMDSINNTLDMIASTEKELKTTDDMTKEDALAKIQKISDVIKAKNQEIEKLRKQMKSRNIDMPDDKKYEENRQTLKRKAKEFTELKKKVEELTTENVNLKGVITHLSDSIKLKTEKIGTLENENRGQKEEINKMKVEIEEVKAQLQKDKMAAAESYYKLATDIKNIADKTSGFWNGKKKDELVKMAYEYYKKSGALGNDKGNSAADEMKTNKDYKKYLTE